MRVPGLSSLLDGFERRIQGGPPVGTHPPNIRGSTLHVHDLAMGEFRRVDRQVTSDLHASLVCDLVEALRTCSTLPELRAAVAAACEDRAPDTQPESAPSWDVDSEIGKEFGG